GQLGKGLRVALTVLDFGRTTFGASCTGAAKFCLARAAQHASTRVQFGETIGSFEMVKEKLAYMRAGAFAMESATYQTAALIDSGAEDYMLETAMLKVFATEVLWKIVNDTFQIFGGKAYFTDEPYERLLRDHRINMIGEGANDVLRAFIVGLFGMRDVGLELKGVLDAVMNPFGQFGNLSRIGSFASRRLGALFGPPRVEVSAGLLEDDAANLAKLIGVFGSNVERLLRRYQESVFDRQYQLGRIADAAIELYVSSCVLNRLDRLLVNTHAAEQTHDLQVGRYYLRTAARRIRRNLADLWDNDDEETSRVANLVRV
ncbi:MAG TPA: acyl-CoA dehydrogenase family protein, partial [Pirellulales bacterium]|nr:acyl-CoA dehydrogenase family protein [Pirellulales bacterium]